MEFVFEVQELLPFALEQPRDGDARCARHHLRHFLLADLEAHVTRVIELLSEAPDLGLELR